MTANSATSLNVYPQEDDEGNPVSFPKSALGYVDLMVSAVNHRIRIFHVSRPSNDFDPGDARTGACRAAPSWC
jgi:hypothetical protein